MLDVCVGPISTIFRLPRGLSERHQIPLRPRFPGEFLGKARGVYSS